MGWTEFHRRRDVIDNVLHTADQRHDGELPFEEVPRAVEEFGTPTNLLLALHHQWSRALRGYIRDELTGARDGEKADAVGRAWHRATTTRPILYTVVAGQVHAAGAPTELRAIHESDLRTLATCAGLVQRQDTAAERTRIGATFLELSAHEREPAPRPPRRSPIGHLRSLLTPTA